MLRNKEVSMIIMEFDGMPPIATSLREEFDGYDVDLTMGEITIPTRPETGVSSVSWALCVE